MRLIDLARLFAEDNADDRYTFIGRNFTSSNSVGVLIYHMLISSVYLHFPHTYAFVTETTHFSFLILFSYLFRCSETSNKYDFD